MKVDSKLDRMIILRDAEMQLEYEPTYTLDQHVAEQRENMGADRWDELNAEWEQSK